MDTVLAKRDSQKWKISPLGANHGRVSLDYIIWFNAINYVSWAVLIRIYSEPRTVKITVQK